MEFTNRLNPRMEVREKSCVVTSLETEFEIKESFVGLHRCGLTLNNISVSFFSDCILFICFWFIFSSVLSSFFLFIELIRKIFLWIYYSSNKIASLTLGFV